MKQQWLHTLMKELQPLLLVYFIGSLQKLQSIALVNGYTLFSNYIILFPNCIFLILIYST